MLQILATWKFFASGHPWSGFDAKALGAVEYVGRGQFRQRDEAASNKLKKSSREAERRQTIAERKAAEIAETNEKAGN
jgi:preprotein translocase subunit SecD